MKVLVLSAHPDDEVLGCGGTISKWSTAGDDIFVYILSEGTTAQYGEDKIIVKRNISSKIKNILGIKEIFYGNLPDAKLDTVGLLNINRMIEEKIKEVNPDVILTHFEGDISQDHKAVFQSSAVISRPVPGSKLKRVLSYEVPSGTEWGNLFYKSKPFTPNYFVDISEYIEKKIEAMNLYEIELRPKPHPRSIEGIRNLAAYRGQMIGVFFAESFNVHYWKD